MTKKYLCGVVSAAVLMGACPTAVFAADLENPIDFRSRKSVGFLRRKKTAATRPMERINKNMPRNIQKNTIKC